MESKQTTNINNKTTTAWTPPSMPPDSKFQLEAYNAYWVKHRVILHPGQSNEQTYKAECAANDAKEIADRIRNEKLDIERPAPQREPGETDERFQERIRVWEQNEKWRKFDLAYASERVKLNRRAASW